MKKLMLGLMVLFISVISFGQNGQQITGKVTDTNGEALPGVSIFIKGTTTGSITDIDGNYSLAIQNDGSVLVYSFIGFKTQEIEASGKTIINVVMQEDVTDLDEVVVVGYGEMRKSDVTGSIASVQARDEVARQYPSVDMLLQGRASGLQVVGNAGSPGGAVSVRIRGTNSLRGNNEPLYVVDGVIISTAGTEVSDPSTDANEIQAQQNGLTGLNPRDIEKVEVLKDASATAIYGSRGANGVVMITTKSGAGKKGKATVSAYGTAEWNVIYKDIDVLDGIGFANYQNEFEELSGNKPRYHVEGNQVYALTYDENEQPVIGGLYDQVNWQDEVYEMSLSHNEGMAIRGGSEKGNYYFSAGFSDQKGIVETTRIKRSDLRLNLTRDISDRLKMDTRVSMMYQDGTFAQAGSKSGGNRSFTKQVLGYRPLIGEVNEDDLDLDISNPYSWLTDFDDKTKELRINSTVAFTYEIMKGLKYKINTGLDYRKKDRSKFYDTGVFVGQKENGLANYSYLDRYAYVIDNLLMYNRRFNKVHNINAVAGVTYDGVDTQNKIYEVANFPDKSLRADYPQAGQTIYRPFSILMAEEAIFSALGRVNYSYKDRYVLTASFRADQSSKFRPGNQWGYYPAAAFAWRVMEEPFIKDLDFFHNLKLRVGWGMTGNQAISPYQTLGTYNTAYYVNATNSTVVGNVPARIPNPNLTWETTEQYNAGIDLGFFKGRLNATVDVYYKNTEDLLQEIELGPSNGFANMFINRGEIENKGIEFSVDGLVLNKKDFSIDLGANFSLNRNKVKNLGLAPTNVWINGQESSEVFYFGSSVSTGTYFKQPANIFMEGQPIGMFWGWQTNGIYQDETAAAEGATFNGNPNQAGDVIFVDQNGDGNIDDMDKTLIGNPNPDFTYGFSLNVRYKRLTLSALFDGVYGNDIINGYNMELAYAEGNSKNILTETYEQAWRVDAPSNTYPRLGYAYNEYLSDRIVEDGSYFRLNNLTLGYDIPVDWTSVVSNLHIYGSCRNLFTITNYSGYNPQITSFLNDGSIMGVDWIGTPDVQTYLIGMNITF
ncbi:TonB-dependent receptor [Carboxylicivirga sediminis]|uniref:TonB-dependent receptor n=1 Tax=Carboxylicivirga sediminis TaxID=2006564 RepID=A0A941F3X8_9BACT|nr:TonB-dependent receptor [Carboxylicivirga sediminis]MBR8536388.1 TonB-dependent receptor [Carboxylicivirga sediminis]